MTENELKPDNVVRLDTDLYADLPPRPVATPNQDLITMLETHLADARAGRLQGLAYASAYADWHVGTGWSGKDHFNVLCGGVMTLFCRMGHGG